MKGTAESLPIFTWEEFFLNPLSSRHILNKRKIPHIAPRENNNIVVTFLSPILLPICACLLLLSACTQDPNTNTQHSQNSTDQPLLSLNDSHGKQVTIEKPLERIISFSPAFTEILFAIDANQTLVGRDDFSDFPATALSVPVVGDAFSVNLETIVELEPNLVYLSFDSYKHDIENLDIPVLFIEPAKTIKAVLLSIELAGEMFDKQKNAQQLIAEIEEELTLIDDRLEHITSSPSIYFELDPGLWTTGPSTFIGDILSRLKATNIVQPNDGDFPQFSNEMIIERNPDIIILAHSNNKHLSQLSAEISTRPGWDNISAVTNNRIYKIDSDLINRPGPRIKKGIRDMAKLIYPDIHQ